MKTKECLEHSLSSVIEHTAFMFADPLDKKEVIETDQEWYSAEISFSGPANGHIVLAAPSALCDDMAVNMLGLESRPEGPEKPDALCEILNMTCGRFLTEKYGAEPIFNLTPPKVSKIDDKRREELLKRDESLAMQIDDKPLITLVEIKGQ